MTTSRAAGGAGLSTPKIRDGRKEPTTLRCVQVNSIITSEHSGDVAVSAPAKDGPDEPRVRVYTTEQVESTQTRRRDDQTSRISPEDRTITEIAWRMLADDQGCPKMIADVR